LKSAFISSIIQAIEGAWYESGAWSEYLETMRQVLFLPEDPGRDDDPHTHWLSLPDLCCRAAGGNGSLTTTEVAAAWACLQAAAHALDKVEDREPLEDWLQGLQIGQVINASNGLVFTASLLLGGLLTREKTSRAGSAICQDFYRILLEMGSGQHQDLSIPEPTVEQWMAIAGAKSGAFFGLACRSGARLGSQEAARIEIFGRFGYSLGILLQLRDDITDIGPALIEGKRPEDLNRSLAVAYAREMLSEADKKRLSRAIQALQTEAVEIDALVSLLDQCGAGLFLRAEIERKRREGLEALRRAEPVQPAGEKLANILTELSEI
jgi:hypothetical protein